jgi:hypothetical protein
MTALWLACLAAMALGLWLDTRQTPAALLASECGAPGSLWDMAWRHATLMPASSAAMVLAALAPWPRRHAPAAGRRLLCAVFMAIGMVLGARLGAMAALAWTAPPFAGMVIGMAAGMAAGLLPAGLGAGNGDPAGCRRSAR